MSSSQVCPRELAVIASNVSPLDVTISNDDVGTRALSVTDVDHCAKTVTVRHTDACARARARDNEHVMSFVVLQDPLALHKPIPHSDHVPRSDTRTYADHHPSAFTGASKHASTHALP